MEEIIHCINIGRRKYRWIQSEEMNKLKPDTKRCRRSTRAINRVMGFKHGTCSENYTSGHRLVRNVHRQDFEDLEQQAFIGIMEAVRRYDPAAGVKVFHLCRKLYQKIDI